MNAHEEIPLPVSPFVHYPFRAVREARAIRFEATSDPRRAENGLRYGILILIAAGIVAFYVFIAVWLARDGSGPGWWFHGLMAGFALLVFGAAGGQVRFADRLAATTVSRRGDGALEVRYRWRNGTERVHLLTEPARLMVLLRHDESETISWHDVSGEGAAPRKEKFRDEVQIELYLVGTAIAPGLPFLKQRWRAIVPTMPRYFREPGYETNRDETVNAARPLASALQDSLGIPVEFRVAGGPLLERLASPHSA